MSEEVKNLEELVATAQVKNRSLGYFAEDGSYGDAVGLTIMETTHWNEVDWEIIEAASDAARPEVARVLTESYEPDANEEALRDKLDKLGIDLTEYEK